MSDTRMVRQALRRVSLILVKTLCLAVGMLVVLGAGLSLTGSEKRKGWIEGVVGRATGLELSVEGELDIEFDGDLRLSAEKVELVNPGWSDADPNGGSTLFSAESIDLDFSLRDLWARRLRFDLELVGAKTLIETDSRGRSNWSVELPAGDSGNVEADDAATSEGGFFRHISPRHLRVTDAIFISRQPGGEEISVEVRRLSLEGQQGGLAFELDADYQALPFTAKGESGSLEALHVGPPSRMFAEVQLGTADQPQIALAASGTLGGIGSDQGPEISTQWKLSATSVEILSPFVPKWVSNLGEVEASGRFEARDGSYGLFEVVGQFSGQVVEGTLRGSVSDLLRLREIETEVEIQTNRVSDFLGGFGLVLPVGFPSVGEARGSLSGSVEVLGLENAVVELADGGIRATVVGSIRDLTRGEGIDATVRASASDLSALSTLFGTELPDLGAVEATGRLIQMDEMLVLEDVEANLSGPYLEARARGRVDQLEALAGFDLSVSGETSSLGTLLDLVGVEVDRPLPAAAHAEGRLRGKGSALRLEDGSATVSSENLSVDVEGSIRNLGALTGIEAAVVVGVGNLAVASELVGAQLPELGPVAASATVRSRDDGRLSLADIDAHLTDPILEAHASGSVASLLSLEGIDLAVDLETSKFVEAVGSLGYDLDRTIPGTVTASGRVTGDLERLVADDVRARLVDDGLAVEFVGRIDELRTGDGIAGQVDMDANALSKMSRFVGRDLPELGSLDAGVRLERAAGVWSLEQLDVKLERAELNAEIKGSIADLASLNQGSLDLVVHLPSLKKAMVLLDPESTAEPGGGLDAETTLRWEEGGFRLDPLEVSFGTSSLVGVVTRYRGADGSPAKLRAHLQGASLNVADVRQIVVGGARSARRRKGAMPSDERAGKIFSTADLPFQNLLDLDAQIDLRADRVVLFGSSMHDLEVQISVSGGLLSAELLSLRLDDQPTHASLEIDATTEPSRIKLELESAAIDPNLVFPEDWLTGGRMMIDANLETRGDSISALMASLNGSATIEIRGAETRHEELSQYGESIVQQINPRFGEDEITELRCIATELEAEDGLLRSRKGPIIVTETVAWFVNAEVDLREERLEIHLRPRARRGFGVAGGGLLAGLVEISGPISSPELKVDPLGIAVGVMSVLKTLVVRGGSILKGEWHDLEVCNKIAAALDSGE